MKALVGMVALTLMLGAVGCAGEGDGGGGGDERDGVIEEREGGDEGRLRQEREDSED